MKKDNPAKELDTFGDQYLAAYGLTPLKAPEAPPSIADRDVTALTNDELTALYVKHAAYAAYIGVKLGQIEASVAEASAALDHHTAVRRLELKEGGVHEAQILPTVKSEKVYLDLLQTLNHRKMLRTILTAYSKNYRTQYAALSRVASIRQIDIDNVRGPGGRRPRSYPQTATPGGRTGFGQRPAAVESDDKEDSFDDTTDDTDDTDDDGVDELDR